MPDGGGFFPCQKGLYGLHRGVGALLTAPVILVFPGVTAR